VIFRKLLSKLSCVYLLLEKLVNEKHFPVNEKHFPVNEKFNLVFMKVFSFYFEWKTLSISSENFINIILFADYIKFSPQTFNCYIFFFFWIFVFQFHPLEFNFILTLVLIFIFLFPYHFLIEIFYLSNLVIFFLLLFILFEIIYEILIIMILIFLSFNFLFF